MRKIPCFTESLIQTYVQDFHRDAMKFFRASKLTLDHLGTAFKIKNDEYTLIGRIDDKDVCCQKNDGSMWAIDRIVVQRQILGETNTQFKGGRNLKKIEK